MLLIKIGGEFGSKAAQIFKEKKETKKVHVSHEERGNVSPQIHEH
jgi:hypothetical protein